MWSGLEQFGQQKARNGQNAFFFFFFFYETPGKILDKKSWTERDRNPGRLCEALGQAKLLWRATLTPVLPGPQWLVALATASCCWPPYDGCGKGEASCCRLCSPEADADGKMFWGPAPTEEREPMQDGADEGAQLSREPNALLASGSPSAPGPIEASLQSSGVG